VSPVEKRRYLRLFALARAEVPQVLVATLGTVIYAIGIAAITIPLRLPDAGLAGIAILSHYVFAISPAWVIAIGNLALLWWSWQNFSRHFLGLTLYVVTLFSVLLKVFEALHDPLLPDLFLLSVLSGVLKGLGIGLIFRAGASQGGIDIIVMALRRRYGIEVGQFSFYINLIIISGSSLVTGLQGFVYGAVSVYVAGMVIDRVLHSAELRKQVLIITDHIDETNGFILGQLKQGTTLLSARGGYTRTERPIILSLLSVRQEYRLKRFLAECDPHAFMVVSDAVEVLGSNFKRWQSL
jgi:uncharacterized membrane-anchored protein YitT (DUF2179 family)